MMCFHLLVSPTAGRGGADTWVFPATFAGVPEEKKQEGGRAGGNNYWPLVRESEKKDLTPAPSSDLYVSGLRYLEQANLVIFSTTPVYILSPMYSLSRLLLQMQEHRTITVQLIFLLG